MSETSAVSSARRGKLIVFEGLDRAGKSSQAVKLEERLREDRQPVVLIRFPDRSTSIGSIINSYLSQQIELDDHAVHLLFSANRWELLPKIQSHIDSGTTVILDRYLFSGAVYSAAKQISSLPLSWAVQPDIGLPRPDLLLFLDLDPTVAASRAGFGDERYEKAELQARVKTLFGELLGWSGPTPPTRESQLKTAGDGTEDSVRIDADGSFDDIHQHISSLVYARMAAVDRLGLPLTGWKPRDLSGQES